MRFSKASFQHMPFIHAYNQSVIQRIFKDIQSSSFGIHASIYHQVFLLHHK